MERQNNNLKVDHKRASEKKSLVYLNKYSHLTSPIYMDHCLTYISSSGRILHKFSYRSLQKPYKNTKHPRTDKQVCIIALKLQWPKHTNYLVHYNSIFPNKWLKSFSSEHKTYRNWQTGLVPTSSYSPFRSHHLSEPKVRRQISFFNRPQLNSKLNQIEKIYIIPCIALIAWETDCCLLILVTGKLKFLRFWA